MAKYCAPGKGDSISCFTLSSLERIANHWNTKVNEPTKHIKLSKNKKILWKRIKEQFQSVSKCPDEYCWLDTDVLKDIKDQESLEKVFRPKMPFPWKKDIRMWLNTLDIGNVLEQYPFYYEDFEFIGVVPLDFDKQIGPGQCIVTELCNINIEKLYKKGKRRLGVVFNMDPSHKKGSHWIAMYMDFNKGGIYYFDSYGLKPQTEIARLLARLREQANAFIYKQGTNGMKIFDDTHTTVCKVEYVTPTTAKFSCLQFVKGLYIGDIVGSCELGRVNLNAKITKRTLKKLSDNIKEIRVVTDIDTRTKTVTFNKPFNNINAKTNGLVHKCFKIYINKVRHQFKDTECGTYCIYFITQMLYGVPFHQIGGGRIILDEHMNKNRTYFFRPNHNETNDNPWLEELFK